MSTRPAAARTFKRLVPPPPLSLPSMPYKGLVPFTEDDAAFFFGRDEERAIIAANLASARLTLLYGSSGVGKTSVLSAGVVPDLRAHIRRNVELLGEPHLAVVSFQDWTPGSNPVNGLLDTLRRAVSELVDEELQTAAGFPRLAAALSAAGDLIGGKILVILDQFEEYFLYRTGEYGEGTFAHEFIDAMNDPELHANVLISMREDVVTKLGDRFQGDIPGLYDNYVRVDHLLLTSARDAIREPLRRYNEFAPPDLQVSIEDALVDAVLRQLEAGQVVVGDRGVGATTEKSDTERESRIETPYLQLVMERLWQEDFPAKSLRLETLNTLGGAEEIVRTHLDTSLSFLSEQEKDVAARIFRHLVTPSGTKIALTKADLVDYARTPGDEEPSDEGVSALLEKLSAGGARVVHSTEQGRFEIFHDVLATPILDWRTRHERAREASERRERRRKLVRRRAIVAVIPMLSILVVTLVALLVIALRERSAANEAQRQTERLARIALSRGLGAQALLRVDSQPDLALLLAVEALRLSDTTQGRSNLLGVLQRYPRLAGILRPPPEVALQDLVKLEYSPDGRSIGGVDADGRVLIWDASMRQPLGVPPVNEYGPPTSMAFSLDGTTVAVGTSEGRVFLWDTTTVQAPPRPFARVGGGSWVETLSFSSDGSRLIALSGNSQIIEWDITSGRSRRMPSGQDLTAPYNQATFTDDGTTLASSTEAGIVSLTDVATGHVRTVDTGLGEKIFVLEFSPDGHELVVATGQGRVLILDPSTGIRLVEILPPGAPLVRALSLSDDGRRVAVGYEDSGAGTLVSVFDADTGHRIGRPFDAVAVWPAFPRGLPGSIAISPTGRTISTPASGGRILQWDAEDGPLFGDVLDDVKEGASVSADRTRLALARSDQILVTDVETGEVITALDINGPIEDLTLAPDGTLLAVSYSGGEPPEIWRLEDGEASSSKLTLPEDLGFIGFSPDSKRAALVAPDGVVLWDLVLERRGPFLRAKSGRGIYPIWLQVAFSHDGELVAVGNQGGTLVYRTDTGDLLRDLRFVGAPPVAAFIDPDAVLTGDRAMAFSPNGRFLVAGTTGGGTSLVLLDVQAAEPMQQVAEQVDWGTVVSVDPGGSVVATGSFRGVILWDMSTSQPIGSPFPVPGFAFDELVFASDYLFTVSTRTVMRWDLRIDTWIDRACRIAGRNLSSEEWALYLTEDVDYETTCPDLDGL